MKYWSYLRRNTGAIEGLLRPLGLCAIAGLLVLSGCGYKGPLTLPPQELAQHAQPTQHNS